jgi:hypothetical protein
MAHQAITGLLEDFIQRKAAHTIVSGVKDWEVKKRFIMGGVRSLNEALNQT